MTDPIRIRDQVRERYGALAAGMGQGCCGPQAAESVLPRLGYTEEQAAAIPTGANLGLGCGNPLAHAGVRPGETVLDLGSGAGIDAFLAARETGPGGKVIGVDMTPAMLERARANAAHDGYDNVEFRLGEIEHLPVADASVDVIISNCVVNLSPFKEQVFREAFRVLRPGGRLVVSDIVLVRPLPPAVRDSVAAYVGCVAGACMKEDYLRFVRHAGFAPVEVVEENRYVPGESSLGDMGIDSAALEAAVAIKVRARKT